jgi:hypothetical protein
MASGSQGTVTDWNPLESLPEHFLIIMYGLRRSGKTVMMKQLLYDIYERIQGHAVYLFSQTASVNKEQYEWLPGGEFSISDITGANLEMKLRDIINEQKERIAGSDDQMGDGSKKGKSKGGGKRKRDDKDDSESKSGPKKGKGNKRAEDQKKKANSLKQKAHLSMRTQKNQDVDVEELIQTQQNAPKELERCKDVLIILDDCCNDQAVRSANSLGYLATCGRHIRISVIILSQVVAGSGSVPPVVRTQADTIVCGKYPCVRRNRSFRQSSIRV